MGDGLETRLGAQHLALCVLIPDSSPCELEVFRCANNLTLPVSERCDGDVECGDGSDEIECCKFLTRLDTLSIGG